MRKRAWEAEVGAAAESIEDFLDVLELMAEEEAEGTAEDAALAHDAVEDAVAYLFDEVAALALLAALRERE